MKTRHLDFTGKTYNSAVAVVPHGATQLSGDSMFPGEARQRYFKGKISREVSGCDTYSLQSSLLVSYWPFRHTLRHLQGLSRGVSSTSRGLLFRTPRSLLLSRARTSRKQQSPAIRESFRSLHCSQATTRFRYRRKASKSSILQTLNSTRMTGSRWGTSMC